MPHVDRDTVMKAAQQLSGRAEHVLQWYSTQKIRELDNLTAAELVDAGRGDQVIKYLELLEAGALG